MAEWVKVLYVGGPRHSDKAWVFFSDGRPDQFDDEDATYVYRGEYHGGLSLYRYDPSQ